MEPAVDLSAARHKLTRGLKLALKRKLLSDWSERLELIWFPYYLLGVAFGPNVRIQVTIDAISGSFSRFNPEGLEIHEDDVEALAPVLAPEEAARIAEKESMTLLLRGRGAKGEATENPRVVETERICFPYWVYTYRRRRGRFDLKVLDAVTGKTAGAKVKGAILESFIREGGTG